MFFQPKDFLSEALGAVPKTPLVFLMKPSSISHRCYLHFFFKVTNQQKSSIVLTIPSIQPEQRDQVGFECYHAVMGFVKTFSRPPKVRFWDKVSSFEWLKTFQVSFQLFFSPIR